MTNILIDLYYTNTKIAVETVKKLSKNMELLYIGIPYLLIFMIANYFAGLVPIFGGLIIFIFQSMIISSYLYIIRLVLNGHKFDINDMKTGFTAYFRNLYITFFVIFIINYGFQLFLYPLVSGLGIIAFVIRMVVNLSIIVFFNPFPEIIYQKYYDFRGMIDFTIEFIKENWIQWYVPNILVLGLLWLIWNKISSMMMSLMFGSSLFLTLFLVIQIIILQGILGYIMLYRGALFQILSTTTLRKRVFSRK